MARGRTDALIGDTSDMVVIHRVFRREMARLPRLVGSAPAGDVRRAERIAAHLDEIVGALHHHHSNEDELLWPRLTTRATLEVELVRRMEQQHEQLAGLLARIEQIAPRWRRSGDAGERDELARLLTEASTLLDAHLHEEETQVLPLVRRHITIAEWSELGERGMASIPPKRRLVFLGHILEETSPQERRAFLTKVPPPARLLYRAIGQRQYRRELAELTPDAG